MRWNPVLERVLMLARETCHCGCGYSPRCPSCGVSTFVHATPQGPAGGSRPQHVILDGIPACLITGTRTRDGAMQIAKHLHQQIHTPYRPPPQAAKQFREWQKKLTRRMPGEDNDDNYA